MMRGLKLTALLGFTCLTLAGHSLGYSIGGKQAAAEPDWMQDGIVGVDASISHGGERWLVDKNGKTYRWKNGDWAQHGSRSNFKQIDAADDGAIALDEGGRTYVTANDGTWQPTGINATDVGVGGGKIWLAGVRKEGQKTTLRGDFSTTDTIKWEGVAGALTRLDVDPKGRAWGIDRTGTVFVHTDENGWIIDGEAPKAFDIGVGGNGAVYLVEDDLDDTLGGGRVFARDPQTGEWDEQTGRLSAVTVTPDGKAFGVNTLNWVIAGNMDAVEGGDKIIDGPVIAEGDKTLADIVGETIPGANRVKLSGYKFTDNKEEGWTTAEGRVELNGSPVDGLLYAPHKDMPIIGLKHAALDLGTYVEKLRQSPMGSFGLANGIVIIVSDQTGALSYETKADMPTPLAGLFGPNDYNGLFPLELKPGVTVIGTWGMVDGKPTDGNVKRVLNAFKLDEKGYAIKGHFTVEQLKNPSLSFKERTQGAGDTLAIDKREMCKVVADNAPISGLDLSFPLPNYKPAFAQGAVSFDEAHFMLKEIDGKIEPAILSAMTFKMPKNVGTLPNGVNVPDIGIETISMAGKLSVQGSLNTVCEGLSTQTEGQIFVAGSTSLNASQVKNIAFDTLSKVAELGLKEETKKSEASEKEKKEETKKIPEWGWKNPFGAPMITLKSFAMSGEFKQEDQAGTLARTLKIKSYSNAILDRADIKIFGDMDFNITENGTQLEIDDWNLRAPGPIALNDLPIAKDTPYLDEFVFKDIDIAPSEMIGTLDWPAKKMEARGYLKLEQKTASAGTSNVADVTAGTSQADEYNISLFARFNDLTLGNLSSKLPDVVKNARVKPAVIGISTIETTTPNFQDMSAKMKPIFEGILGDGDDLNLVKGLTVAGVADPKKFLSGKYGDLLTDYIEVGDALKVIGLLEHDVVTDELKGEFTAQLNDFALKQIPATILKFSDSELLVSALDNNKISIETKATIDTVGLGSGLELTGQIDYISESADKNSLSVALVSGKKWSEPFKIPTLEIENLGFEAAYTKDGQATTKATALVGDGTFRGQTGEVKIISDFENGKIENSVISFEGRLKVSELMEEIPAAAKSIGDATFTKILLSTNAVAGDVTLDIAGKSISGRGAVIRDDSGAKALFIRSDNQIKIDDLISNLPMPLDQLMLPKGVFVIGSKAVSDFNAGDIPDAIYEQIFDGLVDDDRIASLNVTDGLMFLTMLDMDNMPSMIKSVTRDTFGVRGVVPVAGSIGGIYGGDPSFGFYTMLKGVMPDMPPVLDEFVVFSSGDADIFVRGEPNANSLSVGVSAKVDLKMRRLDDLSVQELKNTDLSLSYSVSESNKALTASVNIPQNWNDPLGLEGFSLTKPSVEFGQSAKGTVINIHTKRAAFNDGGTIKSFSFDLDSTWVKLVPTDLAMQLAKVCMGAEIIPGAGLTECEDLTLTPATLARVQQSIFDLVFRAGSNLKDVIIAGVKAAPIEGVPAYKTVQDQATTIIDGFANAIQTASGGMYSLIENSPLSMIGVRDPVIYFGTPGSTPPSRPDVERPPLGFGLHVGGEMFLDIAGLDADLAEGVYKVNLIDGYLVQGKATPPAPFSETAFTVSGNMPLLGGPQHLRFNGKLEVPGATLPGGLSLGIEGNFDVSQGGIMERSASIAADVTLGGVLSREGSMTLNGTTLSFSSPISCTDIPPLAMEGSINVGTFNPADLTASIIQSFTVGVPDPIECMTDIGEKFVEFAEKGIEVIKDPLGTGEDMLEDVGEMLTDPTAALENMENLANAPLDTADAIANIGITIFTTGVDKVPVIGPVFADAAGAAFDAANGLKNAAMGALTNNQATKWLSDGIGASLGAVSGVAGKALGTISDWGSSMFGGTKQKAPVWHRINPSRCKPGFHHWNDVFKQCFENGAIVFFDEQTRQSETVGDCIRVKYRSNEALTVGNCFGDATSQFHINPETDQITSSWYSYYGYDTGWYGPGKPECLTVSPSSGEVFLDSCHKKGANSKWSYRDDMKLENRGQCITRNSENKLVMGDCASANSWLGTSIVANWNEIEQVPIRGRIRHKSSGLCWFWDNNGTGPYTLTSCSKEDAKADKEKRHMRTHPKLRVLNKDHVVEIEGAGTWTNPVQYGCMGLQGNNVSFGVNVCHPDYYDTKHQWRVVPVTNSGGLDFSRSQKLKDILKGDYVFQNVHNGSCLYIDDSAANMDEAVPLRFMGQCASGGQATPQAIMSGYEPDNLAQWVMIDAGWREEAAFNAAREKMKPNLQKWQRHRIRSENQRIDTTLKATNTFRRGTDKILNERKSPGQCRAGYYWNQNIKDCAKEEKMVLLYNNSKGERQGCLRHNPGQHYQLTLFGNCSVSGAHENFQDVISFRFDEKGRIKSSKPKNGNDLCLQQDRSFMPIKVSDPKNEKKNISLTRAGFKYCSDQSTRWGYSPSGELVSSDGQCLREVKTVSKKYNLERGREYNRRLTAGQREINARLNAKYANELAERDRLMQIFRAPRFADRIVTAEEHSEISIEYDRLTEELQLNVMAAEHAQERADLLKRLRAEINFYDESEQSVMVFENCQSRPMDAGQYRWIPSIGTNFANVQGLPETAKISVANDNNSSVNQLCLSNDMALNGNVSLTACSADTPDQYYAFGGVDRTRFVMSSRNSKTCIYNAGEGMLSHRPCQGRGGELFLAVTNEQDSSIQIRNAQSGQCLNSDEGVLSQNACDEASSFNLNIANDWSNKEFSSLNALEIDAERTATAQDIWNKAYARAKRLYMGAYLNHAGKTLAKGTDDQAVMIVPDTIELEELPSHINPITGVFEYIPEITVPKTDILAVPGFADGADRVTFVHALELISAESQEPLYNVNPYYAAFGLWWKYVHLQKVLSVSDNGALKFDYAEESSEFRNTATFIVTSAPSGESDEYMFESVSNRGQYLAHQNGQLILSSSPMVFEWGTTAQWFKNENLNLMTMEPPLRAEKTPFENWRFPDTETSILNKDFN